MSYSARSLPQGHVLIEPYFYDVSSGHTTGQNSFTYFLYGATDRLTVGAAPDIAFNSVRGAADSSGVHLGDTTLRAQYMLVTMDAEHYIPDLAFAVLQTLPTGKYDRLGRGSDGFGGGAYTTSLNIYSQLAWWMPNGRLLRTRFNVAEAFSPRTPISGASVYGTDAGFLGHAQPGNQLSVNAAAEYSLTRNWVLAMDLIYSHGNATITQGSAGHRRAAAEFRQQRRVHFAPAIEYNFTSNLGVLAERSRLSRQPQHKSVGDARDRHQLRAVAP